MPRLHEGDAVPDVELRTLAGAAPRLASSPQAVWLCLWRYAACPFCNMRVHLLTKEHARIQALGLRVIGVFPSPKERIEKYLTRYQVPFELVSDPSLSLYAAFGAETSVLGDLRTAANVVGSVKTVLRYPTNALAYDGSFFQMPAEFLVQRGVVAKARYGRTLDDGFSIEDVEAWAKSRRTAG